VLVSADGVEKRSNTAQAMLYTIILLTTVKAYLQHNVHHLPLTHKNALNALTSHLLYILPTCYKLQVFATSYLYQN